MAEALPLPGRSRFVEKGSHMLEIDIFRLRAESIAELQNGCKNVQRRLRGA